MPIGRAFRKYGWDGFYHSVLYANLSENDAKKIEVDLIRQLRTQEPEFGYNICAGGNGVTGWHPSEETRRKLSNAARGKYGSMNNNYGHRWAEEMRAAASIRKKENYSKETRDKLSVAAKKRVGPLNPFYGRTHSDETKKKLSEYRSQPVEMLDGELNVIASFPSIKEAAAKTGANKVGISNCCRGKTKTSGGYVWRYLQKHDL